MNNEVNKTYCSRCGSEMNANSRYCMKCGNLNELHPENDKYKKIMNNNNTVYEIGSGNRIKNDINNKNGSNVVSNKRSNRLSFIIVNSIIVFIMLLFICIPLLFINGFTLTSVLGTNIAYKLLLCGCILLSLVSSQIIFIKMDEYWWSSFIPFYNTYLLCKNIFGKGLYFILFFIPIVNVVFLIIFLYLFGKKFGKSGILTVLFYPIMLLIIAFGSSAFENIYYVADNTNSGLEKTYKVYRIFGEISLLFIILGIVGSIFVDNNLNDIKVKKDKILIKSGAEVVLNNIENAVLRNNVDCYDDFDNKKNITMDGEYYFYSNDFLYDFGFSSNVLGTSTGYVKVVNNDGYYSYYISYKSGDWTLKESNSKKIEDKNIVKNISIKEPTGIKCYIK